MSGKNFFSKKSIYLVCILACLCLGACDVEKTNNRDSSFSVEQDNANSRQEMTAFCFLPVLIMAVQSVCLIN